MRPEPVPDVTDDAALGGRLRLLQPRRGHRFGHDAMLLAAATPAHAGNMIVDLGAGVGAAGLAIAARVPGVRVALVEIDPALASLASQNAARNGFSVNVVTAVLDAAAPALAFADAGLDAGSADCVIMNPPFNDAARTHPSRDAAKRAAHVGGRALLAGWVATAARLLRDGGHVSLIYATEGLDDVLVALADHFGAVTVMPIYPKPNTAAIRILATGTKGSRQAMRLVSGLCLNGPDGQPTRQAEDVLRRMNAIDLGG